LLTMLFSEDDRLQEVLKATQGFSYRSYGTFPVTWHFLNLVVGQSESFPYFLDFVTENHDLDRRKHVLELMQLARLINPFVIDQAYQATRYFNRQLRKTAQDYLRMVYQTNQKALEDFLETQNLEGAALQAFYEDLGLIKTP
jgi:hypothetical protein